MIDVYSRETKEWVGAISWMDFCRWLVAADKGEDILPENYALHFQQGI